MCIVSLKKTTVIAQNIFRSPLVITGILSIVGTGLLLSGQAQAIPFTTLDARSAAMGGTGVATHARNAAYYNPALLAAHYEDFDAIGLFPVHSESTIDPGNVESGLARLITADQSGSEAAIRSALTGLTNKTYNEAVINSAAIIVPSTSIGAAGFVNSYKFTSAKTAIGGDSFSPVTYNSTLEHRSLSYKEIGAGVGNLLGDDESWFGPLKFGLTAKILLFESYGYSESIETASIGLDRNKIRRDSMINFDFGIARETGVWKAGLVVKNLISADIKYGAADEKFHVGPQVRVGMAYESRRMVAALDVDVTTSEGIGFAKDTAYVAAGVEFKLLPRLYLRGGVQQNRVGDALTTGTFGIGVDFWGVMLDVAGQTNKDASVVLVNIASSF